MLISLRKILLSTIIGTLISFNVPVFAQQSQVQPPQTITLTPELRRLLIVINRIKEIYIDPVNDSKLYTDAINGIIAGLDPHSTYYTTDGLAELKVQLQGEFGGIGIEVNSKDKAILIISPLEDTPAWKAGLKANDLIIKIDDTFVDGMTLDQGVKLMRGKPGTSVTLLIVRKDEPKPLEKKLIREVIRIQTVKSTIIEPGYVYFRVSHFQEATGPTLAKAVVDRFAENKDGMKGMILDLRNDPGGLLDVSIGVAGMFLPEHTLVTYTQGRSLENTKKLFNDPENYVRTENGDYLKDLPEQVKTIPMVVLVNGGSASASEIVAGALQDNKRAIILGTQTFGKGSVQQIVTLPNDTAVKLTIARYFTPSGRSIQAKGITPDLIVEEATVTTTATTNLERREANLTHHITNPQEANTVLTTPAMPVVPTLISPTDYQLNQAIFILKGMQIIQK